jgi:ribosomal-protein-alanine N-acetyltransferase
MVAEHDNRVVGCMIYELHKNQLHILNFSVRPDYRRRNIGRKMGEKLIGKLSQQRRNRIVLEVRETNLAAQMFFRRSGFKAMSVLRDYYDDTTEDAYVMHYSVASEAGEFAPSNRIARLAG